MACVYCNGERALLERIDKLSTKGDFYPGITVDIDENMLCIDSVADVYEPNYLEAEIKINFCPMCGRDLEEEP